MANLDNEELHANTSIVISFDSFRNGANHPLFSSKITRSLQSPKTRSFAKIGHSAYRIDAN